MDNTPEIRSTFAHICNVLDKVGTLHALARAGVPAERAASAEAMGRAMPMYRLDCNDDATGTSCNTS